MLPTGNSGRISIRRQRDWSMRSRSGSGNAGHRMTAMRNRSSRQSEMPALRVGYEEVTKHLDARDRFELFGINKKRIEGECVRLTE